MDDRIVVVTVIGFWGLWWFGAVIAKRSWIPVIPVVPLVSLLAGLGLNAIVYMLGAYVVVAGHALLLASMVRGLLTNRS